MLRITGVDLETANPVVVEDSIVKEVGNNEVNRAKIGTKKVNSKSQDKSKDKN